MSLSIEYYCPRWGSEHLPWSDFAARVADAGYDGIEVALPRETPSAELDAAWDSAARHGLQVIAQHFDTYEADFDEHRRLYEAWFGQLAGRPVVKVNSQTGKDFFGFAQNSALFDVAAGFAEARGVEVVHETHRNKFSFAAHVTRDYLERLPGLRITLDASHWVNVSESYLADQPEALRLAVARTDHIHARVGYPEGPQVPDPRVDAWREAVDVHLAWWDAVVDRKRAAGAECLTVTPEFGPPPYMVTLPRSGEPIADQWAINAYVMELLRERYG